MTLTPLEEKHRQESSFGGQNKDCEAWFILQYHKWCVIFDDLANHPFTVSQTMDRAEQWRRVRDHLKQTLDEPEMIDWVIEQIDVATNLAAGIHEMRPRKDGPCYVVLMEWVANRKHKAMVVLQWDRGELVPDFPTFKESR